MTYLLGAPSFYDLKPFVVQIILRPQVLISNCLGRASVDSVGYRLGWEFRMRAVQAALPPLMARCRAADSEFRLRDLHALEGPAWSLVSRRPAHLLDRRHRSWEALLLAVVDAMLAAESPDGAR